LYFNPSSGDLSATNFNTLSDIAYKENIEKISDDMEILKLIETYSFNWKETGKKSYGVIAQELEQILPELVNETNGIKNVSYIPLIAIIIAAIKTLDKKIEDK
jgi:hypothetical protein